MQYKNLDKESAVPFTLSQKNDLRYLVEKYCVAKIRKDKNLDVFLPSVALRQNKTDQLIMKTLMDCADDDDRRFHEDDLKHFEILLGMLD